MILPKAYCSVMMDINLRALTSITAELGDPWLYQAEKEWKKLSWNVKGFLPTKVLLSLVPWTSSYWFYQWFMSISLIFWNFNPIVFFIIVSCTLKMVDIISCLLRWPTLCLWESVSPRATLGFWDGTHSVYEMFISVFTLLCLTLEFFPAWSQGPSSPKNSPQTQGHGHPFVPHLLATSLQRILINLLFAYQKERKWQILWW